MKFLKNGKQFQHHPTFTHQPLHRHAFRMYNVIHQNFMDKCLLLFFLIYETITNMGNNLLTTRPAEGFFYKFLMINNRTVPNLTCPRCKIFVGR